MAAPDRCQRRRSDLSQVQERQLPERTQPERHAGGENQDGAPRLHQVVVLFVDF